MNLKQTLKKKLPKGTYPPYLTRISEKELSLIAHAKRFKERYTADPAFRDMVAKDPKKAARKYSIKIDPEEIRPIWDPIEGLKYSQQNIPPGYLLKLCMEYEKAIIDWTTQHKSIESIANPDFGVWRQRQIARSNSEMGMFLNHKIVHAPVCFELSAGCTVGCWFCAISADRFAGAFAYTPENKILWKEVLEATLNIAGTAARSGFCYWATDPFDNPDYEKLIVDYHTIIGSLPGTNTAMSFKDIPRTKSLIHMWENYGFTCNHLSILTVKILNKIHEEFTPEELIWTTLNLVNKNSTTKKATAGRALEKIKKLNRQDNEYQEIKAELTQGTIACVSGFLFNMVEKKVRLISPCKASDRWPKGYIVFDEGSFTCGKDLKVLLECMIKNNMALTLENNMIIKFRSDLQYKQLSHGFELKSEYSTQKIENPVYGRQFGELIQSGSRTVDEIIERISSLGATPNEIQLSIDALYKNGLLER